MDKLRVLWLDNRECIIFNSFEKRVSGRCPAFVGKVAERVNTGEKLESAINAEKVDSQYWKRTYDIIMHISGNLIPEKFHIKENDKKFSRTLVLCPTANCNLRCLYCSGTAGEKTKEMMSWSLAKDSIDCFFELCSESGPYTLQFHGAGEPLLNFEVVKKSVLYAKKISEKRGQSLFTRISTNGIISKDTAKWVAQNIDHVSLSLDGPPEIQDLHRPKINGSGSYKNVLQTIKELEVTGVLKRINTVVTNYNIDKLEDILKHIRSISNVKELRLLPVSNCGRCEKYAISEVESKKFQSELNRIIPLAESLDIKLLTLIEQVDYFTEYYCGACGFNMCVAPNGNLSTCIEVLEENDPGANEMIVGKFDFKTRKFNIDWEKIAFLRTRTYKNINGCNECTYRTNCSGSCLVRAARKSGTVMSYDEEQCKMIKDVLTKHYIKMADSDNAEYNTQPEEHKENNLSFEEAIKISKDVINRFKDINPRDWTLEVSMIELMKQLGDLSKRIMTYEGYYLSNRKNHPNYVTTVDNIANELADIMLGLIRIAEHYKIDLEKHFKKARNEEIGYIESSIKFN